MSMARMPARCCKRMSSRVAAMRGGNPMEVMTIGDLQERNGGGGDWRSTGRRPPFDLGPNHRRPAGGGATCLRQRGLCRCVSATESRSRV